MQRFCSLRLQKIMKLLFLAFQLLRRRWQPSWCWTLTHIVGNETQIHIVLSLASLTECWGETTNLLFNSTEWLFRISGTCFCIKLESSNIKMLLSLDYLFFWHFSLNILFLANVSESRSSIWIKILTHSRT